jgi:hypothetical protein
VNARTGSRVAWLVCGLTFALLVGASVLFALNHNPVRDLPYYLVAEATAALVGGLISSRRPRNPVGWIVAGHTLCFTLGEFTRQYAIYGLQTRPGSLPFALAMASPPYWIWFPGVILMFSLLLLYFPDGRLLSPRWRPVAWLAVFVVVVETGFAAVRPSDDETPGIPNPLGIEGLKPLAGADEAFGSALWLGVGAISAASLVARYRRSRGQERQQIKWVAYAAVLLVLYSIVDQFLLESRVPTLADIVLFLIFFQGLWIAIAVAILRYRLYDVDVVINRTLVYASLSASLALVYFGSVVLLQAPFRALTGQESQLAVVASTLAIAALFNPLRRSIQAFIDRRFYRRKYDAARTLEVFGARLRDETDLDALNDELVAVVRETVQPTHVSLWLRPASVSANRGAEGAIKGASEPTKT